MVRRIFFYVFSAAALFIACGKNEVRISEIKMSRPKAVIFKGDTLFLSATVLPEDASSKELLWSSSDERVAIVSSNGAVVGVGAGTATVFAASSDWDRKDSCIVSVSDRPIDMGLSVMWAKCNYGSPVPEGRGNYYPWAELEVKSSCDWETYKWTTDNGKSMLRYNDKDKKKVLDPEDDVASVQLGEGWRMPTAAEWEELLDKKNCSWHWKKYDGVDGYNVVSLITGKSIFLPVTGVRDHKSFDPEYDGYGFYWSSSLSESQFMARYMDFNDSKREMNYEQRSLGMFIRPVFE